MLSNGRRNRGPGEDGPDCSEAMAAAGLPALFEDGTPS